MSQNIRATVGLIAHSYVETNDIRVPLKTFRDAGFIVHVIAADSSLALKTLEGVNPGETVTADRLLKDLEPSSYDACVLTGGIVNGDALRNEQRVLGWIASFIELEKPLAAIGYGVWALVSADAVEGLRLTSEPSMKIDVVNAGGEWVNIPVIVDHMILTCRSSSDIDEFSSRFMGRIRQYAFMNASPESKLQDKTGRSKFLIGAKNGSTYLHTLDQYTLAATEYSGRGRMLQPTPLDDGEAVDTY
jgi:protease I